MIAARTAALRACALAVAALAVGAVVGGTVSKGADLELLADVRRVAGQVAALRRTAFARPPIAVRAPGPLLEVAADIVAHRSLSAERLAARGRAWRDIGLGDGDDPARLSALLARDLAGIAYDPTQRRLLVAPDLLPQDGPDDPDEADRERTFLMSTGLRLDEPLIAHGLVHVLHAERGVDDGGDTTDGMLAAAAWREGEATLLAMKTLYGGMGIGDEILALEPDPRGVLSGALFPDGLDEAGGPAGDLARFVYLDGFAAMNRRYLDGGWDAVAALVGGGRTTRGVMHPDRTAAAASVAAPEEPPGAGLRVVDEDRLGEQGIVVLLARLTGKDNLALIGADGWDGDALWRHEGENPADGVTFWRTRWVDDRGADDFVYAYLRGLGEAGAAPRRSEDGSRTAATLGGRAVTVVRRGTLVEVTVGPASER